MCVKFSVTRIFAPMHYDELVSSRVALYLLFRTEFHKSELLN